MKRGERQCHVTGNFVQAKIIEPAIGPLADRAVAKNHQGSEQHIQRNSAYSSEADVSGEV